MKLNCRVHALTVGAHIGIFRGDERRGKNNMDQERKLGVCPITGRIDYYVPGNWETESIDCDGCPARCSFSHNPEGYENENGKYHGGAVFPKNGFSIFNNSAMPKMENRK